MKQTSRSSLDYAAVQEKNMDINTLLIVVVVLLLVGGGGFFYRRRI
jgi:LPXTG-motif cell wall-anchored protein